jgi:hypothetical protein
MVEVSLAGGDLTWIKVNSSLEDSDFFRCFRVFSMEILNWKLL